MSKEVHDEVIGLMSQDVMGDWCFDFESSLFSRILNVTIEANDESDNRPRKNQYEAYCWLKENEDKLKELLQSSIYQQYQNNLAEIRSSWGPEAEENAPILSDSAEIWVLLSKPDICLLSEYADICVHLETKWDPEHGVTVLIENGTVKRVE
tara:strand:+ start:98 stop:553 length:456 start_codon:yes stop_codon:yes gene_type:complete